MRIRRFDMNSLRRLAFNHWSLALFSLKQVKGFIQRFCLRLAVAVILSGVSYWAPEWVFAALLSISEWISEAARSFWES